MKIDTPFEHVVPTDIRGNLEWRKRQADRVIEEPEYAGVLYDACAADPIFYVNGFCYTYDPRCQPYTMLPFILYDFQRDGLLEILRAIGEHDLLAEKSRDMGLSWVCSAAFEWPWHFHNSRLSFLMGSRTEDYVDKKDNPKSLFWKLDYLLENQPSWIRPPGYGPEYRSKLHMLNPLTGSVIDGESTTGQFARGDRRTAILLDEFAAVEQGDRILLASQAATNSRIFNSTPLGTGNAYYRQRCKKTKRLTFHWRDHPDKSIGLYQTGADGKAEVLKPGYPDGYKPILDGKLRSPAYDIEEKRGGKRLMAQEWDINYLESGDQFFDPAALQEAIELLSAEPKHTGELEYDDITGQPYEFSLSIGTRVGRTAIWFEPRCSPCIDDQSPPRLRPPHGVSYVIGCDISAGAGTSNSALSVYSKQTNEKVLQYVSPYIRPEPFAVLAVAFARWMNNAKLGWESNGPGIQFGSKVMELGYPRIFYRRREESVSKKQSDVPGWHSSKESKKVLLGKYRSAIETKICLNRSVDALQECREYIFDTDGGVVHAQENASEDPSGAKSNHGDRVIADAVAWFLLDNRPARVAAVEEVVPVGSLAWRIKRREEAKRLVAESLDRLSNKWRI